MTTLLARCQAPDGWEKEKGRYAYIGPGGKAASLLGCPDSDSPIAESLWRYRTSRLTPGIITNPTYRRMVLSLHGRTLLCDCPPYACHGDMLVAAADWLYAQFAAHKQMNRDQDTLTFRLERELGVVLRRAEQDSLAREVAFRRELAELELPMVTDFASFRAWRLTHIKPLCQIDPVRSAL